MTAFHIKPILCSLLAFSLLAGMGRLPVSHVHAAGDLPHEHHVTQHAHGHQYHHGPHSHHRHAKSEAKSTAQLTAAAMRHQHVWWFGWELSVPGTSEDDASEIGLSIVAEPDRQPVISQASADLLPVELNAVPPSPLMPADPLLRQPMRGTDAFAARMLCANILHARSGVQLI